MTTTKPGRKAASKKKPVPTIPQEWPAAQIEPRFVRELIPYARNAKRHTKAQVRQILASIREWGWTMPVLVDERGNIIAGHGRVLAAELGEIESVPTMVARGWSDAQRRAYVIADNKLTEAAWDLETLGLELGELGKLGFDLDLTGFEEKERQSLLFPELEPKLQAADAAELPALEKIVVTRSGDLWLLGDHRLLCGDSTRADDVARLMRDDAPGELSASPCCILADPPYGMGKESEGIANDNLYREKLDRFNMEWWKIWRDHLATNGSAYLWGNAPDLWRLWYTGGLRLDEDLTVRNEIVWDKGAAFGMRSDLSHSYPPSTERCLFVMRGQQFLGNMNAPDYWPGWDPLREWMAREKKRAGWNNDDVNRITGKAEGSGLHWFTKSQFMPIPREAYDRLHAAGEGKAFEPTYDELFERMFPELLNRGEEYRRSLSDAMKATRSYFDNTHDTMTDVWRFDRVRGDDRFGHATPKPVSMLGRCIKTSVPEAGLVADPFSGTGTVIVAAHVLGRVCYAMELEPAYVDVALRRWQEVAGEPARLASSGKTFEDVAAERGRS